MRTAQQLIWKTSGRPERNMLAGLTSKMGVRRRAATSIATLLPVSWLCSLFKFIGVDVAERRNCAANPLGCNA